VYTVRQLGSKVEAPEKGMEWTQLDERSWRPRARLRRRMWLTPKSMTTITNTRLFLRTSPSVSKPWNRFSSRKGWWIAPALDALVDTYEHKVGPRNGARVVARAWVDPDYKRRLLANGTTAIAELGYSGEQGADLTVVENTPKVHNLIVCTLCSCYPWPVLGLPPVWYKSAPYRSRAVIDPRGVLHEFGTELAEDVEVHVWDSTAEERYMVLPERPAGTEKLNEEALAALVSRDAMLGMVKVAPPKGGRP
jgi:nitrile hydratase